MFTLHLTQFFYVGKDRFKINSFLT
jgi:hypothetical protein